MSAQSSISADVAADNGVHVHVFDPPTSTPPAIDWTLNHQPSLADEQFMYPLLVLSDHEQGRYIELPTERQHIIDQAARARGFTLTGAYSLRRQFIRKITGGGSLYHNKHNMGSASGANDHAENFERKLELWLNAIAPDARYYTEQQLKQSGSPLTPDFSFPDGVLINGSLVYWLDCKTYYGSSLLAKSKSLPVGKLKEQAERYCQHFGSGAFTFLNGFSSDLLSESGMDPQQIVLLDAAPLDPTGLFETSLSQTDLETLFKEEVYCPPHMVGRIIGKKGVTINNLKKSTGCNVVLHHLQHSCVVVITSTASTSDACLCREMVKSLLNPPSYGR